MSEALVTGEMSQSLVKPSGSHQPRPRACAWRLALASADDAITVAPHFFMFGRELQMPLNLCLPATY